MSTRLARRGTVSGSRPFLPNIPAVAGSAGGGRLGDGTVSITPPAGVDWLAWVIGWSDPATITPPANWSLLETVDDETYRFTLWRSTGSPGSLWTLANINDAGLPSAIRMVGYDRPLTLVEVSSALDAPSPAATATGPCLVMRAGTSFNGTNADASYPTSATLSRSQSRQWSTSYGFGAVAAVAHEQKLSAGAVSAAAWSFTGTPDWAGHTLLLYSSDQDDPEGGLVWSDEFDLAAGTGIDDAEWHAEHWPAGWVNSELQAYTPRLDNLVHGGTYLRIIAKDEDYDGGMNPDIGFEVTGAYTSGRISTKKMFLYGRFEARIKVPAGQGFWNAFWLYGDDEDGTIEWPAQGEIDVMEILNGATTVYGDVHGVTDTDTNWSWQGNKTGSFGGSWHVYSIDWNTDRIIFYVDDVEFHRVTKSELASNQIWPFDRPALITLNLAVGGSWPGNPDGSTPFPSEMQVDYVRVYDSTVYEPSA